MIAECVRPHLIDASEKNAGETPRDQRTHIFHKRRQLLSVPFLYESLPFRVCQCEALTIELLAALGQKHWDKVFNRPCFSRDVEEGGEEVTRVAELSWQRCVLPPHV